MSLPSTNQKTPLARLDRNVVANGRNRTQTPVKRDTLGRRDTPVKRSSTAMDVAIEIKSANIMTALMRSDANADLIGDFSRPHSLPLTTGKHPDLKSITPDTLADLLKGKFSAVVGSFTIVDCRYPYEYEGGHVRGAINVFEVDKLRELFFESPKVAEHGMQDCSSPMMTSPQTSVNTSFERMIVDSPSTPTCRNPKSRVVKRARTNGATPDVTEVAEPTMLTKSKADEKRHIIIFHCEFSSERGPKMFRFMRQEDRAQHADSYPHLRHPEIYLLSGGYKAFYESHKHLCDPEAYVQMKEDKDACRMFRHARRFKMPRRLDLNDSMSPGSLSQPRSLGFSRD